MKKINTNSIVTTLAAAFVVSLALPLAVFAAGPATVNLGSAGNFAILTKSGISTTGTTIINGAIGVSPIAASAITGFGLIMDSSNTFSRSAEVSGNVYAADYAAPTPTMMTTAVSDMQTAYTDAAGRTLPTATELGAGNIGSMTLAPGLYKWSSNVIIPTDVTLSGGANDVWIFQIAQNLTTSSSTHVILSGGAQAANIFWQVAGQTTLGTGSAFNGNILGQTAVVLNTGASLNGRILAQTASTLDSNTVTVPSNAGVITTTTSTATTSIPTTATLHVIKQVNGGNTPASLFTLHVRLSGSDVAGSPAAGSVSPGTSYMLSAGTYVVSEDANSSYTQSFSGSCDASGSIALVVGDNKACTIINTSIFPAVTSGQNNGTSNISPSNQQQIIQIKQQLIPIIGQLIQVLQSQLATMISLPNTGLAPFIR